MFLTLNKKKLKELSNSKVISSDTRLVRGGGDTTERPSKTSYARCVVEEVEKLVG
ncbi:hypothetical protein [Pseudoalteromonas phenolica]|uniref:hypothetical protein n=1 Tax=Pseudoalteromonas phenolica TaxID=161398 RepID=UPI00384D18CA